MSALCTIAERPLIPSENVSAPEAGALATRQATVMAERRVPGRTHTETTSAPDQQTMGTSASGVSSSQRAEDEPSPELIALYEKYRRPLHTYVYRLLGSLEDADDVIQEVFLSAFLSWHHLSDHERLSAWLYRVATNLCMDQLRRRKRISWWPLTSRHSQDQQFERGTDEEASYLPTNHGGIPEIFEREHIHLALARMPEDYAIALVLSADQGISYLDIATISGISPRAAATRISRAKRMFIEQYQRLNEGSTGAQKRRRVGSKPQAG